MLPVDFFRLSGFPDVSRTHPLTAGLVANEKDNSARYRGNRLATAMVIGTMLLAVLASILWPSSAHAALITDAENQLIDNIIDPRSIRTRRGTDDSQGFSYDINLDAAGDIRFTLYTRVTNLNQDETTFWRHDGSTTTVDVST